jgi:hypothetical protein
MSSMYCPLGTILPDDFMGGRQPSYYTVTPRCPPSVLGGESNTCQLYVYT